MTLAALLDTVTSNQLYLIAKEALMNAVKHSGAHAVELQLTVRADSAHRWRMTGKGPPLSKTQTWEFLLCSIERDKLVRLL